MTPPTPSLRAEVVAVLADLSWLDRCTCSHFPIETFFVRAGHTISETALRAARRCPTRRQEVIWAYVRDLRVGYFGGLSGGQRGTMSLPEALEFIVEDSGLACAPPERRRRRRAAAPP